MDSTLDLLVLGAGSGGLAAAKRAARHGAKVAIVEGDRVGGTCVIRGCVPKKLLVYGAQARHQLKDAPAYGLTIGAVESSVTELFRRVRAEVDRLNHLHLNFLEKAGVERIDGWGRFLSDQTIGIATERDGPIQRELSASRVLVAVGGRPVRPDIPGVEHTWISDDMFNLETLPRDVVVVGAGFIACEFACILRGLGVEVTQVVRGSGLLRGFDRELADAVLEGLRDQGIHVVLERSVTAVRGQPGELKVLLSDGLELPCGGVLMATGRRPWLEGLGLEAAGVVVENGRIRVDADSCTSVPHIHAVGDVTDRVNLTPVAIDEGRAFADSTFGGQPRQVNHDLVASAVFSDPELATVGLSEEAAVARHGVDAVVIHRARFRSMSRALPASGARCLLKLVVEASTDRVLGCHMVGEHAAEIIQMAAIAVGMGATKADFDRTMALHPSVSEEFVTMG
ncbi:glutathione-disulfide reductase [Synechococcus sp. A15-28]|uniref:glutathione-disulfide reductase n=1 Tax=Synechococcus sp. A15-28 TaxID=1050638 RepID=UPI001646F2D8|nr:glutathione-disulfide reductase [Synechococcus sp. A15-28]